MENVMKRAGIAFSIVLSCLLFTNAFAQTISFTPSTLIGDNLSRPTSLQFGPDGRLYVAEQFGRILVYTVTRNSANSYEVTSTEVINLIRDIPNHNDDGTLNATVNTRQVTGIAVAGTAANPVIYVTSSDPRIGGGNGVNNDLNLDTNSGVISRLTWNGTQWVKLDLVRGLPRSEENHSPNGLAYDKINNILYMAQGGNTNMGAPSNNFAYLPEYAYSTAILKIDLNAIGNTTYDLPTLDDETRSNVSGNDVNDPFGGNDGLNQGKLVAGGPVTIYSPGWRNNYDIVLTQAGRMYSFDNGPNGGWGGPPTACSIAASEPGTTYCDGLHFVSGLGYYAGFPNPVRANRSITFNASNPQTPIPPGMENPAECNYVIPGSNGSLTAICASTNGMAEYTASNFSNAMKGNLLAVAFNGWLYRFRLNAAGNAIVAGGQTTLASGFGSIPLDVVAQGDNEVFPGTIWVAMYGANDIVVFEPNDFAACAGDPNSMTLDDDGDGYKNGDETQNAADKCSPASVPSDFDHDYVSDLLDNDDDNDGILDNTDKFAQDANNGTTTTIPVLYTYQNTNNGGIGGWGYTGVMMNNTDDYMNLYDMDNMTVGGAAYKFTVDNVPSGDALGALNNQKYAYQLGVNAGSFPFGYVVNGRVMGPFAGLTPAGFSSMGIFMGTGDQDNYLKMVCAANGGAGGIEIVKEVAGVVTSTMYNISILGSSHVNFYLQVDPTTQMVQPSYSVGGGARTDLGPQISVPASWLSNVLAVGFISTSRGSTPFPATWDYIAVEPVEGVGNWMNVNTGNTCTARHESAFVQCGNKFYLMGGRGTKPVESYNYDSKTWSALSAPPMQLHHFQAVELNGLIYVVCAFTGNYPNETPVPNVYIFDPIANTWHVGMDIPAARRRGSAGVIVYNEKIYVVSGLTNGHVSGWVPYVDEFNPKTNTWTVLPDAPHSRDHFQVALHGDQIYAIGGRMSGYGGNTFATTVPETDVYDISEQTWTTLASPEGDIPTQRAACALAVLGDEILAIGGESMAQNAAHNQTEALDVNTNSWRTLDNLNTGRHGTQAIVNNYGVYIAAGCGNRGGSPELNSVEAFYLYGQTSPTGTAFTKGALTVSPGNLNYGQVNLGNSSIQTLYITNPGGSQALVIKGLSMSGGGNYSFVSPFTMPVVLNAGDTLEVPITFAPSSVGTKNGTFTISHSGTNAVNTIINMTGVSVGQQTSVRINAGGPNYTTAAAENYIADAYYSNWAGSKSSITQAIAGTTEDSLYQTDRYGNAFGYAVPVQNGSYTVNLHFAEIWSGANNPGVRVFDVSIENALVIDDLDIYNAVGMYTAYVRSFSVTVNDGTMNIDFAASVNNAKVSAIEIIALASAQGILTAVPSSMIFPETDVNASAPMSISLTNTGGANLTINSVSISGTNASNFMHNFGSAVTLAVGATHSFNVTFTPSASGARTAALSIAHTGTNSPLSVALNGTGSDATASCGYFVEQNGLLVMEVESAPASEGWTSETAYPNYTGTEYYTWTGPNYFHEKGHGMLTYQFKINNPGKYRFKMRTQNGGPLNTHNNDVWVRFPDHGCTFEKNGQVYGSAGGWWKQWQNNLGGWTYNSWAGESTFWEVYVDFPFAGVYSMDISGRAQLYSLDRIVFYRMDMMTDWAATAANPPASPWENCPSTPLVWYKDADRDYYGNPNDSVVSVSKPGVGYVWNKLDCDDAQSTVYPGAPELLDGKDNDCDGVKDEGAYLSALNINCGGSTHYAVNGDIFESDRLYSLPSSAKYYNGIGDILNTDDEPLFRSERLTSTSNNLSYNFKAIPGLYTVTLYWTEQAAVMNPGERVFDVMVEDSVILNDFDIIAVAGYKTAYSYTYNLRLTDSTLNVKVVDVIGKAKINAIKVAQKANTPPTFIISGSSTYNEDFAGTNVMNVTPNPVPAHEAWQVVTYSLSPASVPFANVSINPGTGQVSITSIPNMIGQQQFTITANDGYPANNIATKTFTLKVNAVNDAPAFTLSGNVNVNEDFAGTQVVSAIPATVPADETSQTVTYSLSPASVAFANVSFNNSTGQASITAKPELSGSQVFTVTANDGQSINNTHSQTFTLTVNAMNDLPTLDVVSNITINEDAGLQTVSLIGISAGGNETQALSISVVSDNIALIPNPSKNYTSPNATGSLNFTPVANKNGMANITVTVSDEGMTFNRTFKVTVNPVNDAPLFSMSGNVAVNEDFASTEAVTAIPGMVPADEMSQVVSYSLSPVSVSFANVSINSATGKVTITSVANASGSQTFTVTANDGQSQNNIATATFMLTVNSVNDAPAFALSGNVTVNEDFAGTQTVSATPATVPANEISQSVSYSISPASVSFANISINNSTGQVNITSVADKSGVQIFTVTSNDGQSQNNTYSKTFTLTVNSVNDAPAFTLSGDVTVNEDFAGTQTVSATPATIPADEMSQSVSYSISPASVSFADVSINSSTGEVSITSIANANGSQMFTVTANDGQSQNNTYSQIFTLTVNSVNDAPAFTLSGNVTVNEDFAGTQTVTASPASGIADEASQPVTYSLSPASVSFANISFDNSTGQVDISSVADKSGSQMFTVTANDGQSQNNTYLQTFTLTVNSVNDEPAFALSGNITVNEDFSGTQVVSVMPAPVSSDEMSQSVSYSISPASVSFANISFNSSTGEVSITSVADANGSQMFTVTANDGQSQNNTYSQAFMLTVNSVNDAPAFTLSGGVTVSEDFAGTQAVTATPAPVAADEAGQTVTYSLSPVSVSFANISFNSSTGLVSITAIADKSGSQVFTVTADDGQSLNNTHSQMFTLTVNSVNDAPAFALSGNVTVNEDFSGTQVVSVTPAPVPADEMSQSVSYSISPASVSFANISFNSLTGQVSITAIADANGTQMFTVTADDGQSQNNTYSQTFMLAVNSINNAPAFALSGNVTVNEDFAGTQTVTATPAPVAADEASQTVTYSISPASVSFANISFNSATGQIDITSIADKSGTQTFAVTANDGQLQNNTYSQSFTLTVNSVNDAPAFTLSGNVTVNEDFAGTQSVSVSSATVPADEVSQVVAYSLSPVSVSFANISFNSSTGQVSITSLPSQFGSQLFTVTANDGQSQNNTYSQTFTLTVNSENDAPAFTLSGSVTVNEDFAATQIVSVSPGPVAPDEVSEVVAYSLSPASVAFANISFNSSTGQATITSMPDKSGTQVFTVTANDGQSQNNTYSQAFTLTVNPVNDAPVFALSGNVTVNEDFAGTQMINASPGTIPSDEASQVVTYSLSPASVSFASVSINSSTGQVTVSALANGAGSQVFTIVANDGQSQNSTHSQTFTLTVNPVNDAPAFALSGSITVDEDFAGTQIVSAAAGVVPADEAGQVVAYSLSPSSVSFANIAFNSATGQVSVTSMLNKSGSQVFTITANDGQSQNNTYSQTFTLTVNSVNDFPAFALSGNVTVNEDFAGTQIVSATPSAIPSDETGQVVSYSLSPSSVTFANITINSATGQVSISSIADKSGSQVFTVFADDGQSQNNAYSQNFTLTVNQVNDIPVFTLSGDVTVIENQYTLETVTVTQGYVPADEWSQTVAYSLSPSAVAIANVSINSATGQVTITPVQDQFGTQVFTVTGNDGQSSNNTYSQTFTLVIEEGNNPPSFTLSGDVVVAEDFGTAMVTATPDPVRPFEASQVVTYSLSPASVGFANVLFNSSTGSATFTSVANAFGSQQFTITADDGQHRNNLYSATFMLTVNSVNDAPAFTVIGNVTEDEDFAGTRTVTVTPGFAPLNEMSQTVTYSLSPSVSFANASINSMTGEVIISSIPNASGSQVMTITANDGQAANNMYAATFVLTVNPVNDVPTLNAISNPAAILEDAGISVVSLSGIAAGGGENQALAITAVSNNPSLLSMLSVNYTSPAALGTVLFRPAPNKSGTATVTVTVNDGQPANNTVSRTFVITVNSVNDAPDFTLANSSIVEAEDFTGVRTISAIPSAVPSDEAGQAVTYTISPSSVPFANVQINSATGEVQIAAVMNMFGSAIFTVTANDGQSQNNISGKTFSLTVNPVNDAPLFTINPSVATALKNFTSNEVITVTPASVPADEVSQTVTYSLAPATVSFANVWFNSMTGTVSITSIANLSGTQTFTLTANDGQPFNNLHSQQFVFTVIDTNYQPTLDAMGDPAAIDEDASVQAVQLTGITAGFNEAQAVNVTAVSSNPALIPNPVVAYNNPDDAGTLSYTPAPDQYGVAVITVTVDDGESDNNTVSKSFTVTVNPVNDAPAVNAINDPAAILEDAATQTIQLAGINPGPNETDVLTITAVSGNPSLIPNPVVIYNNHDATGTLEYAPAANQFGSAVITVAVDDGQSTDNIISRTFTITVNPVDDNPVLSDIVKYGQEDKTLGFQAGDFASSMTDVEGDSLVKIRIVSLPAHGALLLNGNAVGAMTEISAADINSLIYDPADEFSGVDSFLWNGAAGALYSADDAVVFININSVNDKPFVITRIPDVHVNEDAQDIIGHVSLDDIFGDAETPGNLTYSVVNNSTSLVMAAIDADNKLNISFVPDANGNATITVQAKDPEGAAETTNFAVTVNSVEDAPSAFSLLTPANGNAIADAGAIEFTWESSVDGDDDVLTYFVTIRGRQLDTTISVTDATSMMLNNSSLFAANEDYQWFVSVSDGDDAMSSSTFTFKILSTGVRNPLTLAGSAEAYPNPVISQATISYVLESEAKVTVKIYSFFGQEIATLRSEEQTKGEYAIQWDAHDAAPGVYFYGLEMQTDDGMKESFVGKMIKQ